MAKAIRELHINHGLKAGVINKTFSALYLLI